MKNKEYLIKSGEDAIQVNAALILHNIQVSIYCGMNTEKAIYNQNNFLLNVPYIRYKDILDTMAADKFIIFNSGVYFLTAEGKKLVKIFVEQEKTVKLTAIPGKKSRIITNDLNIVTN